MVVGVELMDSPDRLCSSPTVPGGIVGGGLTEDNWTLSKQTSLSACIFVFTVIHDESINVALLQ